MTKDEERQAQLEKIKNELDNCSRPLFFFDDDPDGLSSFLLFYRYKQAGKGIVVKAYPMLDDKFMNSIKDYDPDKIFILDIPRVSKEFLNKLSVPIIYVDHHKIFEHQQENLIYFNPHIYDEKDEICTSYWCYKIVNINRTSNNDKNTKETTNDIWIAMTGCVGDWSLPDFKDEFIKQYPRLLNKKVKKPEVALFNSKIGKLVKVFSFILKGNHKEVMACIKVLTRIESPDDILKEKTSQGKFVYKRYEKVNQHYENLINSISDKNIDGNILLYLYDENQWSFTSDLSNELLYKYPDKIIIVCREKSGEFKCSLRSTKHILPEKIQTALKGLTGYGGGHEHACGACIKSSDFKVFLERLKKEVE
ncbi:MAG: DHH family phosphoesterase [Candidatus Woesearchaeota archaeon]